MRWQLVACGVAGQSLTHCQVLGLQQLLQRQVLIVVGVNVVHVRRHFLHRHLHHACRIDLFARKLSMALLCASS